MNIEPGMIVCPLSPQANFSNPAEVVDVRTRPDGTRECAVINGYPNNVSKRWYWEGGLHAMVFV